MILSFLPLVRTSDRDSLILQKTEREIEQER